MGKVKITRELLDSYRRYVKEIPLLEMELESMRQGDNGLNNSVVFDYRKGYPKPQPVVGFDWSLYDRRKNALEAKREKAAAVENWINAIEDVQARCVLRMFYIDGMPWMKIAQKIGYGGNEDYPRKHIRDKYLEKHKIK